MAGAAVTFRFRFRPQGPALKRGRLPLGVTVLSALLHVGFLAAFIAGAALWKTHQPKTYFVNLVPAVAAVGVPQGHAPVASLPPRPAEPAVPEAKTSPAELPERQPTRTASKEMPPRPDASLPERSLPPPSTRLPRPGEKELPALTTPAASPAPTPKPVAAARPEPAAPPPPAPAGRPSGSAQGAGPVTLNVSDFPFAWYLQAVHRKVTDRWEGKAQPGRQPVVVFEIGRNGEVGQIAVEKSSGNPFYDRVALRAIEEAKPFPPLPADFKDATLRIHLGFNFAPERG